MTCKEFGIQISQKRKENEEPVYGKYRQIYAKITMTIKRNPDIESYKTSYEKWKKKLSCLLKILKVVKGLMRNLMSGWKSKKEAK